MTHPNIRPLDTRRDLFAVANLIETCFASQMDADGRSYVAHMRRMAERAAAPSWSLPLGEESLPVRGFVWAEGDQVLGNLTLIPFLKDLKPVYLIANVAVHPDQRQRGIGRQLTQHAIAHVRSFGAQAVWLHVRDDNPVAIHLYQTLGLEEITRRTTWQFDQFNFVTPCAPDGVLVTKRRTSDWGLQKRWLKQNYPPEVAWNLPFTPTNLSPSPGRALLRWFSNVEMMHFAARQNNNLLGVVTYEVTRSHSDWLWLACPQQHEDDALRALLPAARMPHRIRPLMVNYPAGRAADAFEFAGFEARNTLIWMQITL